MGNFDVKTLFILFLLGNIFTVIFFSAYIRLYRVRKQKLNLYLLSKILQTITWLFYVFRTPYSSIFAIALPNVTLLFGVIFEIYAMITVNTGRDIKKLIISSSVAIVYSLIFIILVESPDHVRIITASIFFASYFIYAWIDLSFIEPKTKMQGVTGWIAFFVGVLFAFRMMHSAFFKDQASLYDQNSIQVVTYIAFFLIAYSWPIMFLFLLKEQDELTILSIKQQVENDNISLKELNATKDKLFSIIGHDLRSPFTAILGYLELIIEKSRNKDFEEIEEYSATAYESAHRSYDLLDNLLQWSRVQTGRIDFHPKEILLDETIKDVEELLRANIEEKKIDFKQLISDNLLVKADSFMLETIFRNLVSNAIKYTPPEGKVFLKAKEIDEFVEIEVKDTGVGISSSHQTVLFDLEGGYSTPGTNKEKGTGLGLILCKEFIELHGGTIRVESEVGKGSSFIFTIPINRN